jgi:outer membrane receptor for ferrienterochelin and colicins
MPILGPVLAGRHRRRRLLAAAVLLSLLSATAWAQTVCDDALRQAQKSYDLGLFEDVPGLLAPCLAARPSRATAVQVHSLLARAYLAADDPKKARQEVSAILRLDSSFEPGSTPLFAELVAQVRREEQTVQVASVSKSKESLREAPATVALLTAEEIERRGYNDLEEMLHDLPGFDISRSRGRTYSNIYQRGFRSNTTDRTLFLVDGVEQNDLWSNIAYISRQYPVSNIERVEVVYGPASTMYGANAFAGVINVITKESSKFYGKDKKFGAEVHVTSGSWNTRTAELSLGGRNASESIRWSMTGRTFTSDEPPISRFADWNFNPDDVKNVDYRSILEISGQNQNGEQNAQRLLDFLGDRGAGPPESSPFYVIHRDETGTATAVTLTPAGIEEAQRLDRIGYATLIAGHPPAPFRSTQDWGLTAKLELPNFIAGVQLSHIEEGGIGESTDLAQAGNDNIASPRAFALYAKYSRDLSSNTSFSFFTRYRKHDFGRNNGITSANSFANGSHLIFDLLQGTDIFFLPPWATIYSYQSSTQLQTELTMLYEPSPALSLVGGLEVHDGSLQVSPSTSLVPDAAENGTPASEIIGGSNQLDQLDVGVYLQLSWRPYKEMKIVAGGRLDYDKVRTTLGYGTAFNPRLALIYTPRDFVFKAVYAEGFKAPSSAEKYGVIPQVNEVPNPHLENEKVKNFEVSAGWESHDHLAVEVSAYQSAYSNVVALREVPSTECECSPTGQFQNIGKWEVHGVQAQAKYRHAKVDAFLSYNFTDPINTDGGSRLRVGDIATHHLNGGLNVKLPGSFGFDVRSNFVGSRKTGAGTTVSTNPLTKIDAYTTTNVTLTYAGLPTFFKSLRSASLQLGINNLFDELYYDPGISEARGIFASRLPQAGRSVFLRLSTAY